MPFIRRDMDSKPIKDLLLEYKAEVVEEEVVDEEAEVISVIHLSFILSYSNQKNVLKFLNLFHAAHFAIKKII